MSIILCGLPMSGKTTIGTMLASRLNIPFIDIDRLIETAYFKTYARDASCREIYRNEGEQFFRELEKQCIHSLEHQFSVIALGGGSLERVENQKKIKSLGSVVFLKVSIDALVKRIEQRGMPAYLNPQNPKETLKEIALKRLPLYETIADMTLDIEALSPEQIVEKILLYRKTHGI